MTTYRQAGIKYRQTAVNYRTGLSMAVLTPAEWLFRARRRGRR